MKYSYHLSLGFRRIFGRTQTAGFGLGLGHAGSGIALSMVLALTRYPCPWFSNLNLDSAGLVNIPALQCVSNNNMISNS